MRRSLRTHPARSQTGTDSLTTLPARTHTRQLLGGWLRDFLQGPHAATTPPAPQGLGPSKAAPGPVSAVSCLPESSPGSLAPLLSLGFLLCHLVTFSCLSVSCFPSLPLSTLFSFVSAFLFLPFSLCVGLVPAAGRRSFPCKAAGLFMAGASQADTSTHLGVGLAFGPQSSSLSPFPVPASVLYLSRLC